MLPDTDGWEITKIVRGDPTIASLPIIMLTARVEDADKIVGLELGADDYITKPFNPREVVARVRALFRRSQLESAGPISPVYEVGSLRLDTGSRELTVSGDLVDLTPTEFLLMQTLIAQPGYAFTRDELVEKSLGFGSTGSWGVVPL